MPEKKEPGDQWRQTSVVIRADIFLKAGEMGLDISNECNQALAHLVGIDYRQQQINDRANAQTPQKPKAPVLHPVINADDPAAIAKVMKTKRQPPVKPVPEIPVATEFPPPGMNIPLQVPEHGLSPAGKRKVVAADKKRKDDALKKFVATKITRVDADDAVITKDDMYQAFARWCRDHRCAAVPERKAFATLLKNKFALTEKTVNGTPCWVNVYIR
jgi:hypothetical protein